ncbi:MAG: hypothetical protein V1859_00495 [archaeon]
MLVDIYLRDYKMSDALNITGDIRTLEDLLPLGGEVIKYSQDGGIGSARIIVKIYICAPIYRAHK